MLTSISLAKTGIDRGIEHCGWGTKTASNQTPALILPLSQFQKASTFTR